MIIVDCPSCGAKFRLPAAAADPAGRRVRCSKCAHVWSYVPKTQDQVPDEGILDAKAPATPSSFSEYVQNADKEAAAGSSSGGRSMADEAGITPLFMSKRAQVKTICLRILGQVTDPVVIRAVSAVVLIWAVSFWILGAARPVVAGVIPRFQTIYDLMGNHAPPHVYPLVFGDVYSKIEGHTLKIEGHVRNQSGDEKTMPLIVADIQDEGKKSVVPPLPIQVDARFIQSGQEISFTAEHELEIEKPIKNIVLQFVDRPLMEAPINPYTNDDAGHAESPPADDNQNVETATPHEAPAESH